MTTTELYHRERDTELIAALQAQIAKVEESFATYQREKSTLRRLLDHAASTRRAA